MYDVIIIGAGLSGLAAAEVCKAAGLNMLVLEASERIGGRVWTKDAPATTFPVDFGAEWIIPSMHHEVMALVHAAGLDLLEDANVTPAIWTTPLCSFKGSYTELKNANAAFAMALRHIEEDAVHWLNKQQTTVHPETSMRKYLSEIADTTETTALLEAALFPLTGADPEILSTQMLWDEIGFHHNSVDDTLNAPACRIKEGCDALAKTLAQNLGDNIKFKNVVTHISHQANGCAIQTDKAVFHTRHCIVALPLMTLQQVAFEPALAKHLQTTAKHSNAGRVAKAWALVESEKPIAETFNSSSQLRYGYSRQLDGRHALVCGQILSDGEIPLKSHEAAVLIQANWPDIKVIETTVVDWTHEPFAKASWHSSRAGWAAKTAEFRHPQHYLHFAGGDIAGKWAGWMEGALLSGKAVAQRILATSIS